MKAESAILPLKRSLQRIYLKTGKLLQAGDFIAKDGYAEEIQEIVVSAIEVIGHVEKQTKERFEE